MSKLNVINLLRPHQYLKNFFIFLPLFFAIKITSAELLLNAFIAFIAFSLTASAIYIVNDYYDVEEDKKHPKKKNRPLASGVISKSQSIIIMLILLLTGFTLMTLLSLKAVAFLFGYTIMNIAYSFYLKRVAILDIVMISIGFVLRLFIGSSVTGIPLSLWIVIMTFLLALFLALAKRRDDVLIFLDTGKKMRKVIDVYNLKFLDISIVIMAFIVIITYIFYTRSIEVMARANSEYLYLTSLFVIFGIMRYLKIVFVNKDSGSPTKVILKDWLIQITLLGWFISFAWILY